MSDGIIPLHGPSPQTLEKLKEMLPGFVAQATSGKPSRGRKLPMPRRCCPICGHLFDVGIVQVEQKGPIPDQCPTCKKLLAEGYTACVSDERFAFLKSPDMASVAGKVIMVEKEVMDAIQRKINSVASKTTDEAQDESPKPTGTV